MLGALPLLMFTLLPCASSLLLQPVMLAPLMQASAPSSRSSPCTMGRAEKRMAKKRAAKGGQRQARQRAAGQRPAATDRNDVLSRAQVLARLREVPVFGIAGGAQQTEKGFLQAEGERAVLYMDAREAEGACPSGAIVKGVPLDEIYFDSSTLLRPSKSALQEAATIPNDRRLVPDVRTPLFAIDGMQTTNKDTGVASLPLFFSKAELLEFATPVYGADAADRVLLTDLEAATTSMLKGPVGLLRNAKFFADAKALSAMDKLLLAEKQGLFPMEGSLTAQQEQGLFGGIKMPWV